MYDGRQRLRKRVDYTWNTQYGQWQVSAETRYIYAGNLVIQERNSSNTPTVSYVRGTDLSGSREGAGGIGGLLARSDQYSAGTWGRHVFYHADGNGNVTYLIDASQALAAKYRYDPFGNTTYSSGTLANANAYRFSSKAAQPNSGLYYYGYRCYDPYLQRWLNRDPLGDHGAQVLRRPPAGRMGLGPSALLEFEYRFCHNSPLEFVDSTGEFWWGFLGAVCEVAGLAFAVHGQGIPAVVCVVAGGVCIGIELYGYDKLKDKIVRFWTNTMVSDRDGDGLPDRIDPFPDDETNGGEDPARPKAPLPEAEG
jgi:RHS repeat-associated protein